MKDLHYISALKFFKAIAIVGTSVFAACFILERQMQDLHTRTRWLVNSLKTKSEQQKIKLTEFVKRCC